YRSGPRSGLHRAGQRCRCAAGRGEGQFQAPGGTARRRGDPEARRRLAGLGRMSEQPDTDPPRRSGFVALIGAPNAGKSTLVNRLVGAKVTIVTHKVQTTRALIRGIVIHRNAQIVLTDTPGIFKPRRRLDRAMVTTAWGGAR